MNAIFDKFRFGLEWEPKLAAVMLDHPWPDAAFTMGDHTQVCKGCGRAPGSVNHRSDFSGHTFEAREPFTPVEVDAARVEWRRRMAGLPTEEALVAWRDLHAEKFARLREIFSACSIEAREHIEELGCTGGTARLLALDDIKFLRLALAGSGVGLPCFVPPDRYCLAHETSGGLQDGQTPLFMQYVDAVARPLTPGEAAHDKLVTAARKSEREHGAHSLLHGHTMPAGWTADDGATTDAEREAQYEAQQDRLSEDLAAARRAPLFAWKCDEHTKTNWACRHCVAQAIAEGELVPVYVLGVTTPPDKEGDGERDEETFAVTEECVGAQVETEIGEEDAAGGSSVKIYVRVATFTRKLARD